ncbi:hypothetical protein EGI22_17090 [Lacihabitans sp. LS3-19]|uniref:reprolysin-like metallopeptidase n=1 Tax=Lacihabitans sp. LS3-19 TaxID=2487335 RepID=UPI0020CDAB41|nr:3-coathanger stack domain-containing protein [Lacihabitans sp. LS3-19]MCP9769621.1 hypothetical protein [Lacihabitans sp. LS3-19]
MKKTIYLLPFLCLFYFANAQEANISTIGREVKINLSDFTNKLKTANSTNLELLPILSFPVNNGNTMDFRVKESPIMENQPVDVKTYSGETFDKRGQVRFTITSTRFTAIIHLDNAYYFIEPIDAKAGIYRIYNMVEGGQGKCNVDGQASTQPTKNGRVLSIAPFPNGTQLRTYRMAAAATTNMTNALGGQIQARDKIIEIVNANNLIYELEVSVRFSLITQTSTSMSLIFTGASNPADPFVIDPNFANAGNAQAGFNVLNANSGLPNGLAYNLYDVGHTFNTLGGAGFGASGQAGGSPCVNANKATGWTEFTTGASLGLIVGIYAHEVGHQFNAWHTFNAVGGNPGNATFCTGGWDANTAIEPGSGSTLMGYGGNCSTPSNYVLASPNSETYFHTKSIEQIFIKINTVSNCFTSTATGNTPPVATAGVAFTIPKGTPFSLTGTATDPNTADVLSYSWDEYDVATANDKGAFGATVNGVGGYTAVNSTASAPLFRSRISASPTRMFPDLAYILNNANAPAANAGEALPQVNRTMNFRFTVRDNRMGGGGVDSDSRIINVNATKGPFLVTSPNGGGTIAAGSSQTITWSVNGTNTLSANINILLSIDGGNTFNYTLATNTANDGSATLTIPANVVGSTTCRIKIASTSNSTAEFFDISDGNFTITSSCLAATTLICPTTTVTNESGNAVFNLGLGFITASKVVGNSKTFSTSGAGTFPVINNTNDTYSTCQVSGWGNSAAVLVPFRVSQTGSYTISSTGIGGNAVYSIFSAQTYNCNNFVGGNSYEAIGWFSSRAITLNECTTYYALLYNLNNSNTSITFSVQGTGDMLEILTNPVGFSYTYVAVNQATSKISAVSATSNFTSLASGTYTVYGLQYANAINPATFMNQTLNQAYNTGGCILFSANTKTLKILLGSCPQSLTFVSPVNNITTGTSTQKANLSITAQNAITGGNTTYQAGNFILMNPGFVVSGNAVYLTKIMAGCN